MIQMIPVVAGIISNGSPYPTDRRVLIQRRDTGEWEFPGGKIEPGEQPRGALQRELDEELGIRTMIFQPVHVLNNHDRTKGFNYVVIFYKCICADDPKKGTWLWVHKDEVQSYDLIHPNMLEALYRSEG